MPQSLEICDVYVDPGYILITIGVDIHVKAQK